MAETTLSGSRTQDWRSLADTLGEAFARRAAALDDTDRFVMENYADLKRHGAFAAAVPSEFGGGGASFLELAVFLRTLGRYCGSTALALSMHTHSVARFAWTWKHMNAPMEPLLRRIAEEQTIVVSTGGNDGLDSLGLAERVPGGFRIRARKPFASGSPAGDLVASSAVFEDPEMGPTVLHFMVPIGTDGIRSTNTWLTMGMRATESDDLLFEDVFVPDSAVAARRPRGLWHPVMHLAWLIAQPLIYSVYLGIAEAARDIALGLVPPVRRGDKLIQLAAGEMENALTAARLAVDRMTSLGAAAMPCDETTNLLFACRTLAGESSIRCVELAMDLAGGKAFYRPAGLERRFRDIQAARFHPLRAQDQKILAGRLALGVGIDG